METFIQKERTHLFAPSINIAVVAQFEEQISEDKLYFALKNALRHNEIFCSKVRLDMDGKAFFEGPSEPQYHFARMQMNWRSLILEQERRPFNLEHGEYIRFFYDQNKWGTLLVIITHHIIGDGLSMCFLMDDILKSIRKEELEYKKIDTFSYENIPKTAKLDMGLKIGLSLMNRKWNKTGKIFSFEEHEKLCKDYWTNKVTGILYEQFEEKEYHDLRMICKTHQITINSLFVCAFLKVQDCQTKIGITVNLREENVRRIGNYATGISILSTYDQNIDFWENAKKVHDSIHQKLENEKETYFLAEYLNHMSQTLIDSAYFAAFEGYDNKMAETVARQFEYDLSPKNMAISNLKELNLTEESKEAPLKELFIVPPLPVNAKTMIGISSFHDRMTISYHYTEELDISKEEHKFQRALDEIRELMKTT